MDELANCYSTTSVVPTDICMVAKWPVTDNLAFNLHTEKRKRNSFFRIQGPELKYWNICFDVLFGWNVKNHNTVNTLAQNKYIHSGVLYSGWSEAGVGTLSTF